MFGPFPVQQQFEPPFRAHPEMKLALRAHQQVFFQVFPEDNRPARLALHPQPFRAHAAFFRWSGLVNCLLVSLKPRHVGGSRFTLADYRLSLSRESLTLRINVNNRCLAAPVYPSCTGVSLLSSPSPGPPVPRAAD